MAIGKINVIKIMLKWLTGGALDRALGSVDKYVAAQTDREKIKADIVRDHIKTRPEWLRAGGFWLLLFGGFGYVLHGNMVAIYSILWCADCAYPQTWTIAALPYPHDDYQWMGLVSWFGGLGLLNMRNRK